MKKILIQAVVLLATFTVMAANFPHIHKSFRWEDKSSLPHDGWMVFNDDDGVAYASRIKDYNAVKLQNAQGGDLKLEWCMFSSDGNWVIGVVEEGSDWVMHLVKIEGTPDQWQDYNLGVVTHGVAVWYHNSPLEDRDNNTWEVAWVDPNMTSAYAQKVDLSSGQPVLGDKRKIAEISGGKWQEFSVAGDILIFDDNAAHCVTIPDKGRGTAGNSDVYHWQGESGADRHCGTALAASAGKWSGNQGGSSLRNTFGDHPDGDAPVNHEGCVVLKTKRISDPKVSMYDWVTDVEKGAINACYVPDTVCVGGTCYFQRKTGGADNKWFGWKFLNDEEYIAGWHNPSGGQENNGGYLVRYTDNTWYEVVPPTTRAVGIVAWFDNVPVPEWAGRPSPVSLKLESPEGMAPRVEVNNEVLLRVAASSDSGEITKVVFSLEDGTELVNRTAAPYEYTWLPTQEGSYGIQVTGYDNKGNVTEMMLRPIVLPPLVLTDISLTPNTIYAVPGEKYQFTVKALDQFGYELSTQPTFDWSAGGGTIVDGLYTAGNVGGEYTVQVSAGGVTKTASVLLYLGTRINFQKSGSPPDGWLRDEGKTYGDRGDGYVFGWDRKNETTRNRSNGPDFMTNTLTHLQYGEESYVWEMEIPSGSYKVLVVAGDPDYQTGYHVVNVEGVTVVADTSKAGKLIHTDSAVVTVSDGKLTVEAGPGAEWARICYIVINPADEVPETGFKIYAPFAGAQYTDGDTVLISWTAAEDIQEAIPSISPDNGITWLRLVSGEGIERGTPEWGRFAWVVQEQFPTNDGPVALSGKDIRFRLAEYDAGGGAQQTIMEGSFQILPGVDVAHSVVSTANRPVFTFSKSGLLRIRSAAEWQAGIYDLKGRLLTKQQGGPSVPAAIDLSREGGNAFILQLQYGNRRERRLLINR